MSIIQGTSKSSAATYEIDQSIRFNDNDSAYLEKTFASAGDRQIWTWSAWIKLSGSTARQIIFGAAGGPSYISINENATGSAFFNLYNAGWYWETAAKYRDPSGWYHLVWAFDTTNATADNRMRFYVNGSEVTDYSTKHATGSQNASGDINNNVAHRLGRHPSTTHYYDGYLAEINFIDGQQLDPSSFGETNADTGQWVPKAYTNAAGYGTNGFYITGADSADLGADDSGNGNDFTSSGLAAADQVTDSPTDNFCTWNPLKTNASATLSDGNLNYTASGAQRTTSTFAVNSGKWYAEFTISAATGNQTWGVVDIAQVSLSDAYIGQRSYEWGIDGLARTYNNGSNAANYTDFTAGDVIGIALDMDNGKVWFRDDDGTFLSGGDPAAGTTPDFSGLSGDICFAAQFNGGNVTINCGQSAYTNAPPTGFNALSTANLDDPTIADPSAYFQTTLYTGNGTAIGSGGNAVDQSGNSTFQPDFVWIKNRDAADNHMLYDVVRGATKDLHSNATATEVTDTEGLSTFDTDGFTVGSNVAVNTNTENYVAWQWLADNTAGSSNTDGTISSTVSADTTSGFSIVSYTGTGANATVGHGLGVAPKMIIIKNRPDVDNWIVYHEAMGATKGLSLNSSAAPTTAVTYFNNTAPTSSVFSIGSGGGTNGSGDAQIAYCFAEVEGFSKIGMYTGNGSTNGTFVYTGFKPAFVLWKQFTNLGTNNFIIRDSAREPYNVVDTVLFPNTTAADTTDLNGYGADLLSNGFKLRGNDGAVNKASSDYLYLAIAESPFKTATAR